MGFEIYIEHVTKKVKNKGLILDNVYLKINAGTFTALIGHSSINLIKIVKTTKLNGYLPEQISIILLLNDAQEFFAYTKENILSICGILIFLALIFIITSFYLINRFIKNME